jgi:hypothetical protein
MVPAKNPKVLSVALGRVIDIRLHLSLNLGREKTVVKFFSAK